MSVKKNKKLQVEVEKKVVGNLHSTHKDKHMLSTSLSNTERSNGKKINMKTKLDHMLKMESNFSDSDKHLRLKERKKFKRMKSLECKKKKELRKISNAERDDYKAVLMKNKSSEVGKFEYKKVNEMSLKDDVNVKQINKQSKANVVSNKKKEKRLMWKQKQMAKKIERISKTNKDGQKNTGVPKEKIHVPKTVEEATTNWIRLQQTLSGNQENSTKRKIPYDRIRNPKLRKTDEGVIDDLVQDFEKKEPEIWFDDVDEILLDQKPASLSAETRINTNDKTEDSKTNNPLVKPGAFKGVTKIVCMDCEMVGVGDGTDNMLARVSIVNQYGEPIYDKFVQPKEEVVDYRTHVSGVRPNDLKDAEKFEDVQKDVADILKGRTLVGHAIKNDLKVLYLSHPKKKIRDTSTYKPFKQLNSGRTPSLKKLSDKLLGVKVQQGEHNSVQDAQATMRLYTMYRKQWEGDILKKKKGKRDLKGKKGKT